jgi:hypothetical protein
MKNEDVKKVNKPKPTCRAARSDGECFWVLCPQLRDGEPRISGRSCPLLEQPKGDS